MPRKYRILHTRSHIACCATRFQPVSTRLTYLKSQCGGLCLHRLAPSLSGCTSWVSSSERLHLANPCATIRGMTNEREVEAADGATLRPRRLADLEADRLAEEREAKAWLADHPEFESARFEREQHERRWFGDKHLTTFPIDPDTLDDSMAVLWPPSDPMTWDQEWTRVLVEDALDRMEPRFASVLQRRHFERMTLDAIAAEDGVTRQAIIKRLKKAERKLRGLLGRDIVWAGEEL